MITTICKKCKHKIFEGEIWYNQFCSANRLPSGIDPVSGKRKHIAINSRGRKYYTNRKYAYCKDINDGQCKSFSL